MTPSYNTFREMHNLSKTDDKIEIVSQKLEISQGAELKKQENTFHNTMENLQERYIQLLNGVMKYFAKYVFRFS